MFPEQLAEAIQAVPFVPFTIRLLDYRGFHVDHPDLALWSPKCQTVSVATDLGVLILIPLSAIAEIESQPAG